MTKKPHFPSATVFATALLSLSLLPSTGHAKTKARGVVVLKAAPLVAPEPISGTRVLYLNREGGTYTPGYDDDAPTNVSALVLQPSSITPFKHGDDKWREVVDCMRSTFAPFDLIVTDIDPGASPHMEAMIAGTPDEIGESYDVAGIALMNDDCTIIEGSITMTFANVMVDAEEICWTAAQEAAHAMGLDHSMDCADPMTYDESCGTHKRFQDSDAMCGEYEARACWCGGTQNSVQHLRRVLGAGSGDEGDVPMDEDPTVPAPPSAPAPQEEVSAGCSTLGTSPSGSAAAWLLALGLIFFGLRRSRPIRQHGDPSARRIRASRRES